MLFRCPSSAETDPSVGVNVYIHHTDGCLVNQRLDYGNSTLVGIPTYLVCRIQSALNAAARLIFNLRCSDHITDALVSLHWLRVSEWIDYKIAVLTYRILHGGALRYLGPLTSVVNLPSRRALRSAIEP